DTQHLHTANDEHIADTLLLLNLIFSWYYRTSTTEVDTSIAFTEDVAARYEAYGWQVLEATGEDVEGILDAVERAKQEKNKPTFIRMRSVIAYGAPTAVNTGASHGAALGAEEISGLKQNLGFPDEPFPV